jgi:Na+:H+ antiporter, NhaB family
MLKLLARALRANFLGSAPQWYKIAVIGFLVFNPLFLMVAGKFAAGWLILAEFIFTLAMALRCYPLPSSGLLALQAVVLGLTTSETVYKEVSANLPVILLLVFMVAGIHFMKDLLHFVFTKILLGIRSKTVLSLLFCGIAALLSAFLDALTVIAMIVTVIQGFFDLYHRFLSKEGARWKRLEASEDSVHLKNLASFRGFLRNLLMHAGVGTALGGIATLVGEPQNIIIAKAMDWNFVEFIVRMAPVTLPVLAAGLLTCILLERFRLFGYGHELPEAVLQGILEETAGEGARTAKQQARLIIEALVGVVLILSLAFHVAEVGIIGLMVIVLLTALNGVTDEHRIGRAFEEALPFTSLLVVFFVVIAVIHDQHLFTPFIDAVLRLDGRMQIVAYYAANGLLSIVSDNVFVATVYVTQTAEAFTQGRISREQYETLAIAINAGTNIPSIATPNGQAAFLFLLTSAVSPLIRLSYGRMVLLALPYTIPLTLVGLMATWCLAR